MKLEGIGAWVPDPNVTSSMGVRRDCGPGWLGRMGVGYTRPTDRFRHWLGYRLYRVVFWLLRGHA